MRLKQIMLNRLQQQGTSSAMKKSALLKKFLISKMTKSTKKLSKTQKNVVRSVQLGHHPSAVII